jgi:carbamoyltransferase
MKAFPSWLTEKVWLETEIAREMGVKKRVYFCDHHLSHAASAYFPSPYDRAAILTIDGVGEWSTTTWGTGRGNQINLQEQLRFPNSWGLLYSAFTYYTGFKINSGEYKLMGLAPYGQPRYASLIREKLMKFGEDGAITLNQEYFDYTGGLRMTNARFHDLFGGPPREPESLITQREMDLAASIQEVITEAVIRMARHVKAKTGEDHLVLAGGVALNVVSVGRLATEGIFKELWVQPASGDAGGALGAALWMWHQKLGHARTAQKPDAMQGAFLGTNIAPASLQDDAILERLGAVWDDHPEDAVLAKRVADAIAAGKVVALARGRMEFGPRALGARSILGDARSGEMQTHMNLKIKFRESFRPFAPMVLAEDVRDYFDTTQDSPYMLLVFPVTAKRRLEVKTDGLFGIDLLKVPRSEIPAVTHVDYSARVQTIDERNPFMQLVLRDFKQASGCSVIVNTSFNVRGEPIVCSPADAYRCFMATNMDVLVIDDLVLLKEDQPKAVEHRIDDYLAKFDLD